MVKGTYSVIRASVTIQTPENHAVGTAVSCLYVKVVRIAEIRIGYCPRGRYCAERADGAPICCNDGDSFIDCGAIRTVATIAPSLSTAAPNPASSMLVTSRAAANGTVGQSSSSMAPGEGVSCPSVSVSAAPSKDAAARVFPHGSIGDVIIGLISWLLLA
jgi:hypothetical protein